MSTLALTLALMAGAAAAGFLRMKLRDWTILTAVILSMFTLFGDVPGWTLMFFWVGFAAIAAPLNHTPWRRQFITSPVLGIYRRMVP